MSGDKKSSSGIFRSLTSYADDGFSRFVRRAFLASAGFDRNDLARPVVGIADTSSDYNPCHRDMPPLVEAVKRGVLESGGLPLVFHVASLHEILMSPTTMLYRNMLATETEEMILAQPMDSVVLVGGCDKTLPGMVMGALSADRPFLTLPVGAMRTGFWRGERLGACTDCRRLWARHRAGELSEADILSAENELCSTGGTCMVMGTASTMACLMEALGMAVPGAASPTSGSGARLRIGVETGRAAVALAQKGPLPSTWVSEAAFKNAAVVLQAIGGSTNAVVHLAAMARRARMGGTAQLLESAASVPVLVDCKPSGVGYMEDFHKAGGMPVLFNELRDWLDLNAVRFDGQTLADCLGTIETGLAATDSGTIRRASAAVFAGPALASLSGSLAPGGALVKLSAVTNPNLVTRGRAVVFESPEHAASQIDDPALGIEAHDVLVLRNAGPRACGMPEAGSLPIPKYLARAGVRDMVRISDGRMSGTSYGTVILHCCPESAARGPLAAVQTGDTIAVDLPSRRLDLLLEPSILANRLSALPQPHPRPGWERGWKRLYSDTVLQADEGCDCSWM